MLNNVCVNTKGFPSEHQPQDMAGRGIVGSSAMSGPLSAMGRVSLVNWLSEELAELVTVYKWTQTVTRRMKGFYARAQKVETAANTVHQYDI